MVNKIKGCFVKGCIHPSINKNLKFYKIPADERCLIWLLRANQECLIKYGFKYIRRVYRICSLHFDKNMFTNFSKKNLKYNAEPTLFVHNPKNSKYQDLIQFCKLNSRKSKHIQITPSSTLLKTVSSKKIGARLQSKKKSEELEEIIEKNSVSSKICELIFLQPTKYSSKSKKNITSTRKRKRILKKKKQCSTSTTKSYLKMNICKIKEELSRKIVINSTCCVPNCFFGPTTLVIKNFNLKSSMFYPSKEIVKNLELVYDLKIKQNDAVCERHLRNIYNHSVRAQNCKVEVDDKKYLLDEVKYPNYFLDRKCELQPMPNYIIDQKLSLNNETSKSKVLDKLSKNIENKFDEILNTILFSNQTFKRKPTFDNTFIPNNTMQSSSRLQNIKPQVICKQCIDYIAASISTLKLKNDERVENIYMKSNSGLKENTFQLNINLEEPEIKRAKMMDSIAVLESTNDLKYNTTQFILEKKSPIIFDKDIDIKPVLPLINVPVVSNSFNYIINTSQIHLKPIKIESSSKDVNDIFYRPSHYENCLETQLSSLRLLLSNKIKEPETYLKTLLTTSKVKKPNLNFFNDFNNNEEMPFKNKNDNKEVFFNYVNCITKVLEEIKFPNVFWSGHSSDSKNIASFIRYNKYYIPIILIFFKDSLVPSIFVNEKQFKIHEAILTQSRLESFLRAIDEFHINLGYDVTRKYSISRFYNCFACIIAEEKIKRIMELKNIISETEMKDSFLEINNFESYMISKEKHHDFDFKDVNCIHNVYKKITLPNALWSSHYSVKQNGTIFLKANECHNLIRAICFKNSLIPLIYIDQKKLPCRNPVSNLNCLEILLKLFNDFETPQNLTEKNVEIPFKSVTYIHTFGKNIILPNEYWRHFYSENKKATVLIKFSEHQYPIKSVMFKDDLTPLITINKKRYQFNGTVSTISGIEKLLKEIDNI